MTKLVKSAEDKLSSEKEHCHKAEADLANAKSEKISLKRELKELCKELTFMGKHLWPLLLDALKTVGKKGHYSNKYV